MSRGAGEEEGVLAESGRAAMELASVVIENADEKERRGRLWLKGLEKSRDKRKINKEIEK